MPEQKTPGKQPPEPSYEEAREQLVDVVRRLEQGGEGLEESIALWERGEELAKLCQTRLDGARTRLESAIRSREANDPPAADDEQ